MTDSVELFPIAIGEFDAARFERIDGIDANLTAIIDTFGSFECHIVQWQRTAPECCGKPAAGGHLDCTGCVDRIGDHYRGHDDVNARLRQWSNGDPAMRSILYWVGHGWSNGRQAALVHSRTSPQYPDTEGIRPERIADAIVSRFASSPRPWVIVMIEACQSGRFVGLLQNALNDRSYSGSYLLISPSSDQGGVTLGRMQSMLHNVLHKTFATEDVLLDRFAKALHARDVTVKQSGPIPDDVVALVRRIRLPANLSVDARAELAAAIDTLPSDVRRHFVAKAHGGLGSFEDVVLNEQSWYFEGRNDDTRYVVEWLQENTNGMLVVTGAPGSGKSAFLGNLIVHANPALRGALHLAGLLAESPPGLTDNVFDICLTLTGAPSEHVVAQLAAAVGSMLPDELVGKEIAVAGEWLAEALLGQARPLTIVVDALDEAVFPEEVANYVLRPLTRVSTVRLLVGTRKSTYDQPDEPTADANLLRALGASERDTLTIRTDPQAIRRFIVHRLRNRVTMDTDGFADAVATCDPHFLIAQLAVHEVISDSQWRSEAVWPNLLALDHQGMFALAVDRLSRRHHSYRALLIALACSAGHGLPIHDGVWRIVAQAIDDDRNSRSQPIADDDIERFIDDAAPYVIVDNQHDQTVYRLAHRTFAEHLDGHIGSWKYRMNIGYDARELAVVAALIGAAQEALQARSDVGSHTVVNPYIRHYLSTHAAKAGAHGWSLLGIDERVIALLDPEQVGADALQKAFGRIALPPVLEGITNARDWLSRVDLEGYPFALALVTARTVGYYLTEDTSDSRPLTSLRWARVQRRGSFRTLTGHRDSVQAFAVVPPSAGGAPVLVSADREGAIRMWNPLTGQPVAVFPAHAGAVTALAVVPGPSCGYVLTSAGEDHTVRVWNSGTGQLVAALPAPVDTVTALAVVPCADGSSLLAGAGNGPIYVWNLASGQLVLTLPGHTGAVRALAVIRTADDSAFLVSAGDDRAIRVWNLLTGTCIETVAAVAGDTGVVTALAVLPRAGGMDRLASVGHGPIRVWDFSSGHGVLAETLSGHTGPITALSAIHRGGGGFLLAGAGNGAIRLWDMSSYGQGHPIAKFGSQVGDTQTVMVLAAVPLGYDRALLASATNRTIQLWNPTAGQQHSTQRSVVDRPAHIGAVTALAAAPGVDSNTVLVSAGYDQTVRLWVSGTGDPLGTFTGHTGAIIALAAVPAANGGMLVASAGYDETIRLWNPASGQRMPVATLTGHAGPVTALTAVPAAGGGTLLASAGYDGIVRLWNPAAGQGMPIATLPGRNRRITGLTVIPVPGRSPLLASADESGTIHLSDSASPTNEPVAVLSGSSTTVMALAPYSGTDHDSVLACAGRDGMIQLFDPVNHTAGQPITSWHGHSGPVAALGVVPVTDDRSVLVSAGRDRRVRLWDTATETELGALTVDASVNSVQGMPGGYLAVALDDGILMLRVDPAVLTGMDR